jgi:asparagine N-glycosylation enzyme membrane subunit Stt3
VPWVRPLPHRFPHTAAARGHLLFFLLAGVVLLAALLVRLASAAGAYEGAALVNLDGDSLYHLRRMRLVAEAFPHVPWVDPGIAWPAGAAIPWAAGFDLMGALAILLGRTTGGAIGADLWVASLPAILGVAVVAATMALVHDLSADLPLRRTTTLAAGVLAAALPVDIAISRFGRIDHHVAEALAMVLLARWALAALPASDAGGDPPASDAPRRRLAYEAGGALLSTWALWVFTGSPLYVALVVPVLLAAAVLRPRPRLVGSGGPGLLAGAGLAALLSAPAVAAHGRALAFGFPSWLQPLLLAAAGVAVCGAVVTGARVAPGARRAGVVLLAAAAAGALAALALPAGAAQSLAAIREWLFKADPWLSHIEEFQPLLRRGASPTAGVTRMLGVAGFAAPLAVPAAGLSLLRRDRARAAGFLWLSTTLALLTLLQIRFGRVFGPFLAANLALALGWLARACVARVRLAGALPVVAALALALLDPRVRANVEVVHDPVPDAAIEAALDLRGRAPGSAPGVLAPWDLANAFLVVAGRPVVTNGFGPYPDAAAYQETEHAYTVGEDELLAWAARRRVGWVIAGPANYLGRIVGASAPSPFVDRAISAAWFQQVPCSPLLLGGSAVPAAGVRHLEHLMPVFASTRLVGGIDAKLPVLWTYEVVAGARLFGHAAPGARVSLDVPLTTHGQTHRWSAFTEAGADGAWTLTIPLPTDLSSPGVSTGPARLRAGAEPPRAITIPSAAVRAGGALPVPGRG